MTALLRIRKPITGVAPFVASSVEREDGMVTATGSWKFDSGRLSKPGTYSWPNHCVVEIRYVAVTS